MVPSQRQSLVRFAGPVLLAGLIVALLAAAGGAYAAGLISQVLAVVPADSSVAVALENAWLAVAAMGVGIIALLGTVCWFVDRRVHDPLRQILQYASSGRSDFPLPDSGRNDVIGSLASVIERSRHMPPPPLPDGVRLHEPRYSFSSTAGEALQSVVDSANASVRELKEASGRISALSRDASIRLNAALTEAGRASEGFRAAIEQTRNETAHSVRSLSQSTETFVSFGEDAAARIGSICTRIATGAELLAKAGERVVDQISGTFENLQVAGGEIRNMALEARDNGVELARITSQVKPELIGTIDTLRAASLLFEKHVDTTRGRLSELIDSAARGETVLAQHWGAALVTLAEGSVEVQRNAATLSDATRATTGRLATAAEDFRRAGQILVKEAGAVRGELAAGTKDMRATQATLTEVVTMLTADGGIKLPTPVDLPGDDGAFDDLEIDISTHDFSDFMNASDEVLKVARAIEKLESRTTEFAKRLVRDVQAQPDIDREEIDEPVDEKADSRADETIAALLSSIERINTIAAAISQAGDAAARRIQTRP